MNIYKHKSKQKCIVDIQSTMSIPLPKYTIVRSSHNWLGIPAQMLTVSNKCLPAAGRGLQKIQQIK